MASLKNFLKLEFIKEYRKFFPSFLSFGFIFFAQAINVAIYWYTSKSFVPSFEYHGQQISYFDFVISGEIFLFFPTLCAAHMIRLQKMNFIDGSFNRLLIGPYPLPVTYIFLLLPVFVLDSLKFLVLISFSIFLSPNSFLNLQFFSALFFVFLSLPAFFGIGLIANALLIRFGRGQGVALMLFSALAAISGLYFPIQVFPDTFSKFIQLLSPINLVLQTGRQLLFSGWQETFVTYGLISLFTWSILLVTIGLFLLKWSILDYRKKGAKRYIHQ